MAASKKTPSSSPASKKSAAKKAAAKPEIAEKPAAKKSAAKKAAAKPEVAEKPAAKKAAAKKSASKTVAKSKSPDPKKDISSPQLKSAPNEADIASAAYHLYLQRLQEGQPGDDKSDWYDALNQLGA